MLATRSKRASAGEWSVAPSISGASAGDSPPETEDGVLASEWEPGQVRQGAGGGRPPGWDHARAVVHALGGMNLGPE